MGKAGSSLKYYSPLKLGEEALTAWSPSRCISALTPGAIIVVVVVVEWLMFLKEYYCWASPEDAPPFSSFWNFFFHPFFRVPAWQKSDRPGCILCCCAAFCDIFAVFTVHRNELSVETARVVTFFALMLAWHFTIGSRQNLHDLSPPTREKLCQFTIGISQNLRI